MNHKIQNRRAAYMTMIVAIIGFMIGITIAWYVDTAREDDAPVWICSIMGNHECGDDAPMIDIDW